jgi:hypothetical protein
MTELDRKLITQLPVSLAGKLPAFKDCGDRVRGSSPRKRWLRESAYGAFGPMPRVPSPALGNGLLIYAVGY